MRDLFSAGASKQLRPYQSAALAKLRASIMDGHRRPILQLATGAGKTLIAAHIVNGALAKGKRVMFLVPALSLVGQTIEAFRAEGITEIGVCQGWHELTDYDMPVQVGTVQTIGRRRVIPHFDFAIVDEAHIRSRAVEKLMMDNPQMIFVGLSATPWAKGLGKVYDDLVIGATLGELIDAGYLSKFRCFAPSHPDLSGVKIVAGEYNQGQLGEVMGERKLVADVVSTWLERGEGRPTLCFAVDRAHAAKLQRDFEAAGVRAGYVDAYTDVVEREAIKRKFEAGEIRVVCNCRTLTTGVDWAVGCIIDAAPTKSEMLHVQRVGRGLRVNPGIEDCIVLDHSDNNLRLGLVTDIAHAALDGGLQAQLAKKRVKVALPKECPSCAFLKPAKVHVCPSCGFKPEKISAVEVEDGKLVEITSGKKGFTRAEKQAWWSALMTVAAERGRARGWAAHTFQEKFGCWPRGLDDTSGAVPDAVMGYVKSKDIRWVKGRKNAAGG